MKGILISFEGIDGSGKSTQSKKLYHWLQEQGYSVVCLEEPGGSNLGVHIKKILLYSKEQIEKFSELLLFLAARNQLVKEIILPCLEKGKILILDRFSDSTLAYQGYGRGIDKSLIVKLNKIVTGGIIPNLTILLDKKSVFKKSNNSKDRFENEPNSFYRRVRKGYLEIALSNKTRVKTISVRADKNETFQEIKKAVTPCLQKWKLKKLSDT